MVQWGSPEAQDLDILMPGMVQTCSNPINNGIIIMLGGAGFCPSTVAQDLVQPLNRHSPDPTPGSGFHQYQMLHVWIIYLHKVKNSYIQRDM